jgi:hypothetical protein
MWSSLDTNRKIGSCFTNDPPGQTFFNNEIGFPPALKKTGFEMVDVGSSSLVQTTSRVRSPPSATRAATS